MPIQIHHQRLQDTTVTHLKHRQLNIGGAAQVIKTVVEFFQTVYHGLHAEEQRQQFAKIFVDEFRKNKEMDGVNIVVVYAGISFTATGKEYYAESTGYEQLDKKFVYYTVCMSLKGAAFSFTNPGDGGPKNWYYSGDFTRSGNTITASQYDYEVITYRDADFGGPSTSQARLSVGKYDATNGDIANDSISSIYVPNKFVAFAYEHSDQQGSGLFFPQGRYSSFPNGWNDRISSLEVMYHPDQTGFSG